MNFEQLDLEKKLFVPSKNLYLQTSNQMQDLFTESKSFLIELHDKSAIAALKLYEQPLETLDLWGQQSTLFASDVYASFQQIWLPQIQAYYSSAVSIGNNLLASAQTMLNVFLEQPGQTATQLVDNVTAFANENLDIALAYADETKKMLMELVQHISAIFTAIIDEPSLALENYFMATVSSLLEIYYQSISALLLV